MDIDFNNYWSTKDIMNHLDVSKDWIYKHVRPYMTEEMNKPEDFPVVFKAKNTVWYRKDRLFKFFIKHMRVTTKDYQNHTERQRGEETSISIPEEIRDAVLTGEFDYLNVRKLKEKTKYSSNESIYRLLFQLKAYSVKIFGRTYYYIPK